MQAVAGHDYCRLAVLWLLVSGMMCIRSRALVFLYNSHGRAYHVAGILFSKDIVFADGSQHRRPFGNMAF